MSVELSFETALRWTEILVGLALLQHSLEHLATARDGQVSFIVRAGLSLALVLGATPHIAAPALFLVSWGVLTRFDGPYNGGADRMSLLALLCVSLAHLLPQALWRELALGYLAAQLVLSYALSGLVKLANPDWRSGRALQDVFLFSVYPVSGGVRTLAQRRGLMLAGSWGVILLEILFPLALLTSASLMAALVLAAAFHLANAWLFGLNRFVWAWFAAYPAIVWLQTRVALAVG